MQADRTIPSAAASPVAEQDTAWVIDWTAVPGREDEERGSGGGGFGPDDFDTGLCVEIHLPGSAIHGREGMLVVQLDSGFWQVLLLAEEQWCVLRADQVRPVIVEIGGPFNLSY